MADAAQSSRRGPVDRGKRLLITAYTFTSSYELYRTYAEAFGLSFSDYAAVILSRYHELDDPAWIHIGPIDLTTKSVQPPFVDLTGAAVNARARVSPDHRDFYNARAKEVGVSQRIYLGWVLAKIHGEPPVIDFAAPSRVLRFPPPSARQIGPETYEVGAMARVS